MSDADAEGMDELRDLIARARNDGPAPERLAAVRARLESRIGPLDAPPSPPSPAAPAKVALGMVAVAAVIAIGAWLGTRGGDPSSVGTERDVPGARPDAPAAALGEPSSAPVIAAPVEATVDEVAGGEVAGGEVAVGEVAGGEAAAEEAAADEGAADETAGEAPRPERRARHVAPTPVPSAETAPIEPSAEDSASRLREEIALLDRALRARESGDPARAAAALEEHRARFPSGRLQPERDRMLSELATSGAATTP